MSQILDVAADIFHRRGYDATSMQDIADAVGILKGSLYHYITSKEDLLFGIVEQMLQELTPHLGRWRTLEGDSLTRIATFIEEYVLHIIRNRVKIAVLFQEFSALSGGRRAKVLQFQRQYDVFLRELIESGQKDGSISPAVDSKVAVNAIFGMANWTYRWYRPSGDRTPEEIAHTIASLVRGSLAATG
jgi:AcrR family transcriptional regulator